MKTVHTPGTTLETVPLHYSGCSFRHRHRAGFCKCRYCLAWQHSAMECQKPGSTGKKQGPRKVLNKLQCHIRSQSQVQINAVITVESRMQQLKNSQFLPHIVSFCTFELSFGAAPLIPALTPLSQILDTPLTATVHSPTVGQQQPPQSDVT